MKNLYKNIPIQYFDVSDVAGIGEGKIDTTDERAAFDKVDDDKTPPKDKEDKEDKDDEDEDTSSTDDEDEESEEDEESSEESDDEEVDDEEEEVEPGTDSLIDELKAADKEIFKKIPALRGVIFREAQYSQLFPSVNDAKEAMEVVETFSNFQKDIEEGDPESLIKAVEATGKDKLTNFAGNFLPALEKASKDTYLEIMAPQFKKLFRAAAKSGNPILETSAKNLNYFLFNDTDIEKDAGFKAKPKDDREDKLSEREREYEIRIAKDFTQDVNSVAKNKVFKFISSAFKDSDLSPLMQKKLTEEIYQRIDEEISKDARHMASMKNLWTQAKRAGFRSENKDSIISAYLSRVKVLTPKIRQKVLSEAKLSARVNSEGNGKKATRIPSSGAVRTKVTGPVDPKKVDWNKTDERAMLDGEYTVKK